MRGILRAAYVTSPGDRVVGFVSPFGKGMLPTRNAMRLARAIRNLVKQELAAIEAANKEASANGQ